MLLLWNTLPLLETIRDVMEELADLADISPTVLRPMLQTVGLALVTKLAASLCRDAGEGDVYKRQLLDQGIFRTFVVLSLAQGKRVYTVRKEGMP